MNLNPGDVVPDWTYRPHVHGLPGLPAKVARSRGLPSVLPPATVITTAPAAVSACDCGGKLAALLKVLGLPEGLRGLVLALAAAPDADALDVLADYLEERTDPRAGRFRGLACRARGGATP